MRNKKLFGILLIGLLAGPSGIWAITESEAINKANQDITTKKDLGNIYEDIRSVTALLFKPADPKWHDALVATLENLLDDLVERARQDKIKPEEKQEIIDTLNGLSMRLTREYGNASEYVRQLIGPAVVRIEISLQPAPVGPSVPLTPETGALVPYIDVTKPRPVVTPGVYEEYEDVERIIPVGARPVAQPYMATITPATQEQLNTELRRLKIRADWLRRSMPS